VSPLASRAGEEDESSPKPARAVRVKPHREKTPPTCVLIVMPHLIRISGLGLLAFATASAAPFTFDNLTINVPDGFTIERIASSELADRPISGAFDQRGRLYVTDSAGMSDGAEKQLEAKAHRLLRLEDTDGDGRFDKQTVFADKLMFPEGCLFYQGSVYVAAPPQIWKFTDADDDGVAEKREVWFDGKTLTHCGNDLHGPYLGRDGWFYWTKGAYAEQHYTLASGKPLDTHAAHIFRARPDASLFESVLAGGMANPVGVAFTSSGSRFLSGTFFVTPADGQRDGLIHSIYGGVYGQDRESLIEHAMTGDVMPVLAQSGASAPCGMTCLESNALGDGFRDNLVTCYFNLHKVMRHQVVPDGATFRTQDSDLVWSDSPDFHPTDVIEDADGSIIVIDTGGWYKICCPTSQLAKPDVLGGIYRLRRNGVAAVGDARGAKIAWAQLSTGALTKLLDDPRHVVRQRAIAEHGNRGAGAVESCASLLRSGTLMAKQNALWSLSRISGDAALRVVREALADDAVAPVALQCVALARDHEALPAVQSLLASKDVAIARDAAEALGRIGDKQSVRLLLEATARAADSAPSPCGCPLAAPARVLEHSLIYALIEIGDATETLAGVSSPNPHTRRAALVALDQMPGGRLKPEQVTPLLNEGDAMLRLTASWIVGHHPEWGAALAGFFRARLEASPADDALAGQLARLSRSPAIESLLAAAVRGGNATALRAVARAAPRESPASWLNAIAELIPQSNATVLAEAVGAARALPWPKGGHPELLQALASAGGNTGVNALLRLDALAAARALPAVDPALFDFLVSSVMPEQPVLERSAAANVLARARLTAAQQLALADSMKKAGPLELPKLLPAFEREPNAALGRRLISALSDSAGIRGLRADLLKAVLAKYPKEIRDASQPLLDQFSADAAKQAARLDGLLAALPTGDLRRGQAVFQRAGCIACHRIGYAGGTLGPDVTKLGKVRTSRDLLEAIVFPSASIVRGYEPYVVTTKANETFTGTLAKDERDEIILNIAPQIRQRIARDAIAQMNPINISLMPQGFGELLNAQDLADLLAFLQASQR
jgi:putative membrane-bound dehydrogenase-like protein